ncbi:DUF3993 domain-containing protein [Bacillus sp. AK128]
MIRRYNRLFMVVFTLLLVSVCHHPVDASTTKLLDKQGVQKLLQETYETEYSLTERYHSWEEARLKLTKYMTEDFAEELMNEHMFEEEDGYMFYGTDFSTYIIPDYSYSDDTNIVVNKKLDTIYVYEKSSGTGPVFYESQYDIVTIRLIKDHWRISAISFEETVPDEVKDAKDIEEYNQTSSSSKNDSFVQQKLNVERVNGMALGSIKPIIKSKQISKLSQPIAPLFQLVPYHLLYQNLTNERGIYTHLTSSTLSY